MRRVWGKGNRVNRLLSDTNFKVAAGFNRREQTPRSLSRHCAQSGHKSGRIWTPDFRQSFYFMMDSKDKCEVWTAWTAIPQSSAFDFVTTWPWVLPSWFWRQKCVKLLVAPVFNNSSFTGLEIVRTSGLYVIAESLPLKEISMTSVL